MKFKINSVKGFTLIELSIVVVIIGLIIAGVLGGNVLVNQAMLKSVHSDIAQIRTAVYAFRAQYNGLPGDLVNGTSYYSSYISENGNGDGIIGHTNTFAETRGFWESLDATGLYTKYTQGPILEFMVTNSVTSYRKPESLYRARSAAIYNSDRALLIELGDESDLFSRVNQVVSTQETINLDNKFDDGMAGTGLIKAGKAYDVTIPNNGCTLGGDSYGDDNTPTYNPADDVYDCLVFFYIE